MKNHAIEEEREDEQIAMEEDDMTDQATGDKYKLLLAIIVGNERVIINSWNFSWHPIWVQLYIVYLIIFSIPN